jgi:hypothetical protein
MLSSYRPNDWLHVYYAVQAYKDDGGIVEPGWRLIETYPGENSYFGVAYKHPQYKHIIIANRGTQDLKDILADLEIITRHLTEQEADAWGGFARKIIEKYGPTYTYSFTGHSLGGWLAEFCLWKYQDEFVKDQWPAYQDAFSVTLDDPGGKELLEALQPRTEASYKIAVDRLDRTNYVSRPHSINTALGREGSTVYALFPEIELSWLTRNTLLFTAEMHNAVILLNEFDKKTGLPKRCYRVIDWPRVIWSKTIPSFEEQKSLFGYLAQAVKCYWAGDIQRGEYLGFYTYQPDKVNNPEELPPASRFQLQHGVHYRTKKFEFHVLPLRNIPSIARQFLEDLDSYTNRTQKLSELIGREIEPQLVELLNSYKINGREECALKPQTSAQQFRDLLLAFLSQYPFLVKTKLAVLLEDYILKKVALGTLPMVLAELGEQVQHSKKLVYRFSFQQKKPPLYQSIKPSWEEIKQLEEERLSLEKELVLLKMLRLKLQDLAAPDEAFTLLQQHEEQLALASQSVIILLHYLQGNFGEAKKAIDILLPKLKTTVGEYSDLNKSLLSNRLLNLKTKIVANWDSPEPTRFFTGRTKELKEIYRKLQHNHSIIISGLGGVGKTQIALTYSKNYESDYNGSIQFIESENSNLFESSITKFAVKLKCYNSSNKEISENQFRQLKYTDIKRCLISYLKIIDKCLLIFDNLEDMELIKDFLSLDNHHVIITSRTKEWGEYNILEIESFTKNEAIKYVKRVLSTQYKNNVSNENALALSDKLGFLPLALVQAVHTIRGDMDIKTYLNDFNESRQQRKELLSYKALKQDFYKEVIFTTWDITRKKIFELSKDAYEIINIAVYFDADKIPKFFFLEQCRGNKIYLNKAIRTLVSWCLIKIVNNSEEKDSFSIHRLLREVMQIKLEDLDQTQCCLKKAMKIISKQYLYSTFNEISKNNLISHVRSVLDLSNKTSIMPQLGFKLNYQVGANLSRFDKFHEAKIHFDEAFVIINNSYIEKEEYIKFLAELGLYSVYSNFDQDRNITLLEKEYAYFINIDIESLTTPQLCLMSSLSHMYHAKGKNKETIVINEKLIRSKKFMAMHDRLAIAYITLGSCYSKLENHRVVMSHFDNAEAIFKKYDNSHPDLALFYTVRGEAQLRNFFFEQAEIDFKKSIDYSDKHIVNIYHNGIYLFRSHVGMAKLLIKRDNVDDLRLALNHIQQCVKIYDNFDFNKNANRSMIHPNLEEMLELKKEIVKLIGKANST